MPDIASLFSQMHILRTFFGTSLSTAVPRRCCFAVPAVYSLRFPTTDPGKLENYQKNCQELYKLLQG